MTPDRQAELDRMAAAAEARLDAREDPAPVVLPPPPAAPVRTPLTDVRLCITHVQGPDGARIEFATTGPDGAEVPLAHALPVLMRDTATAIVQLAAAGGGQWPPAIFHAAKTVANAFAALEGEMARMRAARTAADLRAKGVS